MELDASGELLVGHVDLEAFTLDGVEVAPWESALVRTLGSAWRSEQPFPLVGAQAGSIELTRFASQSDFAGIARMSTGFMRGAYFHWTLEFRFEAIPDTGEPACLGQRLASDDDGDGELNARDLEPAWRDSSLGIDENGLQPAQFCAPLSQLPCGRADFLNDEPRAAKPRDCRWAGGTCEPLATAPPPIVLPPPARACLGFAMIEDADVDGERDETDRCASTPAGATIDGGGCSAAQFCALQTIDACRRADFANDEPLAKSPGDCVRTSDRPRRCEAAGAP